MSHQCAGFLNRYAYPGEICSEGVPERMKLMMRDPILIIDAFQGVSYRSSIIVLSAGCCEDVVSLILASLHFHGVPFSMFRDFFNDRIR